MPVLKNQHSLEAAAQYYKDDPGILSRIDRVARRYLGPWFRANQVSDDISRGLAFISFLEQGYDLPMAEQKMLGAMFESGPSRVGGCARRPTTRPTRFPGGRRRRVLLEVSAMSVNCIRCIRNRRTGSDLLCDECRKETSVDQKPSVGRVVHYTPLAEVVPNGGSPKGQPYPAVITHVWSDTCVNLNVMNDGSWTLPAEECPTSVLLGTGPRTWAWPPRV